MGSGPPLEQTLRVSHKTLSFFIAMCRMLSHMCRQTQSCITQITYRQLRTCLCLSQMQEVTLMCGTFTPFR